MLHIWLPTQYSQLYVWLEKQQIWQIYENWQAVSEYFSSNKVCLYFPSQFVLQIESDLPSSQLKQLGETGKQYLFEDVSLTPVEQLRIREFNQHGHHYLYACASNDLEQWVNSASLVGMEIQLMLPDFLLLPFAEAKENKIYLYSDKQTTLLRQSQASGLAVSYFPSALEKLQDAEEILIVPAIPTEEEEIQADNNEELLNELGKLTPPYSLSSVGLRPLLKQAYQHKLNFIVKKNNQLISPYLKVILTIGVLALILQMIADAISIQQYQKVSEATDKAMNTQYQAWFPENRLNARTSLQAQLEPLLQKNSQANNGSIGLLSQVTPLMQQSNITASSLVADENALTLQITASNRQQLDDFVQKLQQQGLSAQLGMVNNEKTQVMGEIVISQQKNNEGSEG